MSNLKIEHRPPGELKPNARNARTRSPKQIAEIAASIQAFGFNNPVLIDKDGGISAWAEEPMADPQTVVTRGVDLRVGGGACHLEG